MNTTLLYVMSMVTLFNYLGYLFTRWCHSDGQRWWWKGEEGVAAVGCHLRTVSARLSLIECMSIYMSAPLPEITRKLRAIVTVAHHNSWLSVLLPRSSNPPPHRPPTPTNPLPFPWSQRKPNEKEADNLIQPMVTQTKIALWFRSRFKNKNSYSFYKSDIEILYLKSVHKLKSWCFPIVYTVNIYKTVFNAFLDPCCSSGSLLSFLFPGITYSTMYTTVH